MYLVHFFLVLYLAINVLVESHSESDFALVKKGLTEYFLTKKEPQYLTEALKNYQLTHLFRHGMFEQYDNFEECELCNLVVDLLVLERGLGVSRDTLVLEAVYVCTRLGIENERVCHGAIELNVDIFVYIIDNYANLTSDRICGVILQSAGCEGGPSFEWAVDIPSGASPERPTNTSSDDSFTILQLSDFHHDPRYTRGKNAECDEPLCCQDDQEDASDGQRVCGYWSDNQNGDSPWELVEETIRQVKTQEFAYVYYTGDIISHRVWSTTVENNTRDIVKLLSYFQENFDVPVFVTFGNHEPNPLNVWPSEDVNATLFSNNWLYELASTNWTQLMGVDSDDVKSTILRAGYYSVSPRPGFRVIAVNSNLCYTTNWWLIYDNVDPFGQLQWLADTLKAAEDNGESVHIISHVPTGSSDCLKTWSREYRRIVERFSNTITGQFNGHTHKDEFHIYYSFSEPTKPVGVSYNGASVTPMSNSNPSYKLYSVEQSTFTLLDYEEWTFNLTLANSRPSTVTPDWYKLYSFTEAYGVDNLQPSEADRVLYNMINDPSLFDAYFRYYYRNGDFGIRDGCDANCQKGYLCSIATSSFGDDTECEYFRNLYDDNNIN